MKLFEPHSVNGKLHVANRIVMPALVTRLAAADGMSRVRETNEKGNYRFLGEKDR